MTTTHERTTTPNNPQSSTTTPHESSTTTTQELSHLLPCTNLSPTISTLSETFDDYDDDDDNDQLSRPSTASTINPAPQSLPSYTPPTPTPSQQPLRIRTSKGLSNITNPPLPLLALPTDALHTVSTFLEVRDWCSVSLTSRVAHGVCRDVFRRVRMHGFKCAAEIITSWEAGEHGDAKELAALYLQSGVPIYPARRRDIYHTLLQRMKAETTEMIQPTEPDAEDNDDNVTPPNNDTTNSNTPIDPNSNGDTDDSTPQPPNQTIDRFFLERKDARDSGGYYLSTLTYLEEKALFWRDDPRTTAAGTTTPAAHPRGLRNGGLPTGAFHAHTRGLDYHPHHQLLPPAHTPANDDFGLFHDVHQLRTFGDPDATVVAAFDAVDGNPAHGMDPRRIPADVRRAAEMGRTVSGRIPYIPAVEERDTGRREGKMALQCHAHLVDRHYLGRPAVFDGDGGLDAAPVNLAADFFHPGRGGGGGEGVGFGFGRRVPRRDRLEMWQRAQGSMPTLRPTTLVAPPMGVAEELALGEPSPVPTEQSGDTLFLTPLSSPASVGARDGSVTPPPPELAEEYATDVNPMTTLGLAPPPALQQSNLPPLQLTVPVLDPPPHMNAHMTRPQTPPPPYDVGSMGNNGVVGGFSRATFPFVVELNVMKDVALHSYSSTYGPYQVQEEQQPQRGGGGGEEVQQQKGMANRRGGGRSAAWRKRMRDRIRHYEAKLKSHLDKPSQHRHNGTINTNGSHKKINYYADHASFNECLLDFWDECFSLTTNIHYFDQHSPIPRATRMWEFLSQPCSKALGTIQCEIERTRTVKKKKRRGSVGVKERLFPTYEYRLFLRDRRCVHRNGGGQGPEGRQNPHHYPHQPDADVGRDVGDLEHNGDLDHQPPPVRLDTVLMSAKYRGKKRNTSMSTSRSVTSSNSQSKKGVNNYYLHMPQKHDIEQHFKAVNLPPAVLKDYEHLVQKVPPSTGKELGRVQSNFIGTEFQIFSPKDVNRCSRCSNKGNAPTISGNGTIIAPCAVCDSSAAFDGGTNVLSGGYNRQASDNTTGGNSNEIGSQQIKSSFRRRLKNKSFRRRKDGSSRQRESYEDIEPNQAQQGTENGESQNTPPPTQSLSRFKSSWLRSRRVIANSTSDLSDSVASRTLVSPEVEIGAITYTANLLGNRPRIMDVCIPKVHSNEWRNYCESSESSRWEDAGPAGTVEEERSMLNKLKLLQLVAEQQLMQHHNQNGEVLDVENPAEIIDSTQEYGLLSLQNRPPWWNVELGAFVLNFGGRVSVASVKNFQLCDRHNHDDSMLQFGRIEGRHSFTMDYSYPLSAVQAFAIAISSLQSKISFG